MNEDRWRGNCEHFTKKQGCTYTEGTPNGFKRRHKSCQAARCLDYKDRRDNN